MTARNKMCDKKVSYRTRSKAEQIAQRFSQRVYECPICFCWHCTNKENWRDEYVDIEEFKKRIADTERKIRTEYNEILRKKNARISELERKIKNMKLGRDDDDQQNEYSDNKGTEK